MSEPRDHADEDWVDKLWREDHAREARLLIRSPWARPPRPQPDMPQPPKPVRGRPTCAGPLRLQPDHRLPPRRTSRYPTGCAASNRRLDRRPDDRELQRLAAGEGRHDARATALIALLACTGKSLTELLRIAPTELRPDSLFEDPRGLRMPMWAWRAVFRLLAHRARRDVWHSPLLFCTFRRGEGNPLHRRDAERMLIRHQTRRGFPLPFTISAIRQGHRRDYGPRISFGVALTGCGRYMHLGTVGALKGLAPW